MRAFVFFFGLAFTVFGADSDLLQRAQNLYNHTDYAAAITALKAPEGAKELQLLGQCYFMDGQYKKAVEVLEKAVALAPNDSDIQTWLGRAYGRRAETSFPIAAMGYAAHSRQAFERAVQLNPANREALGDLFEFYVEAPGMVGGGVDRAKKLLPVIAQNDPAELSYARARIAEKDKNFEAAEAQLRRGVEMSPQQVGRLLDLAKFLYKQGRFDEAETYFRQAEKVAPDSPRVLFARASAYVDSRHNLDQAQALLKKYLASTNLTPDDPPRSEAMQLLKKAQGS
jgi:tetratricopeptide (TPR) repeat protein